MADPSSADPFGGGGLMAALDVMAFTNDIDLGAADVPITPTTPTAKTDLKAEDLEAQDILEDPLREMVQLNLRYLF